MAETPHSQEPQDDQAAPSLAIGSYGAPSSSAGQPAAPAEPEAPDPGPARSPVLPLGYAPVSSTPETSPSTTWTAAVYSEATVADTGPEGAGATAALNAAPLAGSYGGSIGGSYGGSYGASTTPAPATAIPTIVRDYRLIAINGAGTESVVAEVRDNHQRNVSHPCSFEDVVAMRLECLSTHGLTRAQVYAFRVFEP